LQPSIDDAPGPVPRQITWSQLYAALPGNLKLMVLVFPVLLPAVSLWLVFDFRKEAFVAFCAALIMLPIYAWMIWRHFRKLVYFESTLATLLKIERGKQEFSGCYVLFYSYEYLGQRYEDDFMLGPKPNLNPGDSFWILLDPIHPESSLVWPTGELAS
jgi:hypothetical protein